MAGGFQSTRKAGDFPSTGRTASGGGSGTGEVDTVNGISPDAAGNVQLTAGDVGAHSRGDADNKFEPKRATGTIGASDDPTTKLEGDYYATEKFINAPLLPDGESYVGLISVNLDFDGSNNGGLITYYTNAGLFYKMKFAGGWSQDWVAVISVGSSALSAQINTIATREGDLEREVAQIDSEIKSLSPHHSAPVPDEFNSATVALTGGYADSWQEAIHVSTHKTGSPITITKMSDDPHNAVVMMTPEAAGHVTGITIDGGLPAKWESHAVVIGEKQYTAFISPYKLTKHPLDIGIAWS
ncbi:putative coil containing protein [Vibrio phage 284E43-1]|nr:putative coil containing protein [Vibrio phage 284E43-1]